MVHRHQTLAELERNAILAALTQSRGDKLKAAAKLDIGKTTLYRKLNQYAAADARAKRRKKKRTQ